MSFKSTSSKGFEKPHQESFGGFKLKFRQSTDTNNMFQFKNENHNVKKN